MYWISSPDGTLKDNLRTRISDFRFISGKRKLSLAMIRMLNAALKIPAEVLIQDYLDSVDSGCYQQAIAIEKASNLPFSPNK
jgi:hypothetical protein